MDPQNTDTTDYDALLDALIAELEGITFTPPPGTPGALTLAARNNPQVNAIVQSVVTQSSASDSDEEAVAECVLCLDGLTQSDFTNGSVLACLCPIETRVFRHTTCHDGSKCLHLQLFGPVSSPGDQPAVIVRTWAIDCTSGIWNRNLALWQGNNATLCYAAATATASNCAGVPTTVAECAHLFAISDDAKSEYDWAENYRLHYAAAAAALGGAPTVSQVHAQMRGNDTWKITLRDALGCWGSPVFPNGVHSELQAGLSWQDIHAQLNTMHVIMAGSGNHWYVIYGCGQETGPLQNQFLKIYDPMSNSTNEERAWANKLFEIYLIVG